MLRIMDLKISRYLEGFIGICFGPFIYLFIDLFVINNNLSLSIEIFDIHNYNFCIDRF